VSVISSKGKAKNGMR